MCGYRADTGAVSGLFSQLDNHTLVAAQRQRAVRLLTRAVEQAPHHRDNVVDLYREDMRRAITMYCG